MTATLAEGLKPSLAKWETLHKHYDPLLGLVKELIGLIPNCDPILEIWEPGFRTYNLLVPNMFNLPNTLFGDKDFKASVGLAMYASSKEACAYCTAHACSFALRRGASTDAITGLRTPKEQAVVALAEGLAQIPARLSKEDIKTVREYFTEEQTEWLVYAISMMGFLNKFMNATGVELEQHAINDVAQLLSKTGWQPGIHAPAGYNVTKVTIPDKDNLWTYLRVLRHAPGAVMWERKWIGGVPGEYAAAGKYLSTHTGYSFPILKQVKQQRVVRVLSAVLRDNLSNAMSETGLKVKMLAGYVFAITLCNETLKSEIKNLSAVLVTGLPDSIFDDLEEIAGVAIPGNGTQCREMIASFQQRLGLTQTESATLLIALAAAQNPAQFNSAIIESGLNSVKPEGVVEIIVWLSVLQLLHRMSSYYTLAAAA
jgi:hypothetical protein